MSCRDIHATNAFAFIIAMLSVGALAVATVIPQWRTTRLITFNRNAKNVTVYDGLWTKCVQQEGYTGCYYFDAEWYSKVDQLDIRLLQFCLPAALFFSGLALLISLTGMCKTACCSKTPDNIKTSRCLVNSSGCHLVAGVLLFLAGAIAMPPSVWFLFHTKDLNARYDNLFGVEFAVYVSIGGAGGLIFAALLMFMWYCMCKKLPSPFWLPLPEVPVMTNSLSAQPLLTNGLPSPVTYAPQPFPPAVLDAPAFIPAQGYAQTLPTQPVPPQVYMAQMSVPDGYGSEAGASQAYGYAPSQSYAPSHAPSQSYAPSHAPSQSYAPSHAPSQSYAPSHAPSQSYVPSHAPSQSYGPSQRYAGNRYSTRSRMSGIEIDIPVLTE